MEKYYYLDNDGNRHDVDPQREKFFLHKEKNEDILYIVLDNKMFRIHIEEDNNEAPTDAFIAGNGFPFRLYDVSTANKRPERRPIIKNYFYDKTISLIYGQAGSMKTWWCLYEAVCLTLGKKLLDMEIEHVSDLPYNVLYITLEMTAKDIADRVAELCKDLTPQEKKIVNDHFRILSYEDTPAISAGNKKFLSGLGELKNHFGFDFVYIDSFSDYVAGFDLRAEDHMRRVINDLRRMTVDFDLSFRIIHHGTKTFADGSGGAMAGIHTIRDLVDHVWALKQTNPDEIRITSDQKEDPSAKTRYRRSMTFDVGIKSDGETYFSFYRKELSASNMEIMSKILDAIKKQQGITASELKANVGNYKDLVKIRNGMKNTFIKEVPEKSKKGKETLRYYTLEYYNDHEEELHNGVTEQ